MNYGTIVKVPESGINHKRKLVELTTDVLLVIVRHKRCYTSLKTGTTAQKVLPSIS